MDLKFGLSRESSASVLHKHRFSANRSQWLGNSMKRDKYLLINHSNILSRTTTPPDVGFYPFFIRFVSLS